MWEKTKKHTTQIYYNVVSGSAAETTPERGDRASVAIQEQPGLCSSILHLVQIEQTQLQIIRLHTSSDARTRR